MNKVMKQNYTRPCVLVDCQMQLEHSFLLGSIVDQMGVETSGQVQDGFYDVTEQIGGNYTFNHEWN